MLVYSYSCIKQGDGKHVLLKFPHSDAIPRQGDIKQTSNGWQAKLFIIRNQVSLYRGAVSPWWTIPLLNLLKHATVRLGLDQCSRAQQWQRLKLGQNCLKIGLWGVDEPVSDTSFFAGGRCVLAPQTFKIKT